MSESDIDAGKKWNHEIASSLKDSRFGIVCVTPENQHSPWLNFEAGAIAKDDDQSRVCTLLHDLKPAALTGPLASFQHRDLTKSGLLSIVRSMNDACTDADRAKPEGLEIRFEKFWGDLDERLKLVPQLPGVPIPKRDSADLMEEALERIRQIQTQVDLVAAAAARAESADNPYLPASSHDRAEARQLFKKWTEQLIKAYPQSGKTPRTDE